MKASFSFDHIFQKFWYMGCEKCFCSTSADYGVLFMCNTCKQKHKAEPRSDHHYFICFLSFLLLLLITLSFLFLCCALYKTCIFNRCKFDVDLSDDTGTVTATMFGDLAEKLLTFTAKEAMEHYFQVCSYHAASAHMHVYLCICI